MAAPQALNGATPRRVSTYELLARLPLEVEGYALEGLEREVSSAFLRLSTVVRLRGGGEEGVGEDVTYDGLDHIALRDAGPVLSLAGSHTIGSFCDLIGELDLFPAPPVRDVSRRYRRWAFESAALDLALRQAGRPLAEVLGREAHPVTFVVSLRLGEPPSLDPVRSRLRRYPGLRFKLDPAASWDDELVAGLAATGAVDSVDFKGHYHGSGVDQTGGVDLYQRVVRAFPNAWIEDPDLAQPGVDELLRPHRDRITWDAPIHSVAAVEALPFLPRMVNLKPSRLGGLRSLCDVYDHCESHGIAAYGGGLFELGPGRGQIQYLASLFHPDTPNDVAPGGYNLVDPPAGLPASPLGPRPSKTGFRWEG
jgi:L-alanine-DL-glutamate epimerase-like enolase superfamily enzyme